MGGGKESGGRGKGVRKWWRIQGELGKGEGGLVEGEMEGACENRVREGMRI